jgi:ferredoxin-NADP reductase
VSSIVPGPRSAVNTSTRPDDELPSATPDVPAGRRIKELEVMVADVLVETPDTTTLVFFTGNDRLDYKAGHFLTIDPHQFEALERFIAFLEDLKGKREPPRAYSMSSAPHERYLAVTVKEERYISGATKFPPLLSPMLVKRTVRGMRLTVTGFTGPYTLPADVTKQTEHIVHICAGSGSVPNFSMVKFALAHHPTLRHTFVYSNKEWKDVIYRDALGELSAKHPDRLTVIHTLTREENPAQFGPNVRKGRVSLELLREVITNPTECLVYVCGPGVSKWDVEAAAQNGTKPAPKFLESVLAQLAEIGVPQTFSPAPYVYYTPRRDRHSSTKDGAHLRGPRRDSRHRVDHRLCRAVRGNVSTTGSIRRDHVARADNRDDRAAIQAAMDVGARRASCSRRPGA